MQWKFNDYCMHTHTLTDTGSYLVVASKGREAISNEWNPWLCVCAYWRLHWSNLTYEGALAMAKKALHIGASNWAYHHCSGVKRCFRMWGPTWVYWNYRESGGISPRKINLYALRSILMHSEMKHTTFIIKLHSQKWPILKARSQYLVTIL